MRDFMRGAAIVSLLATFCFSSSARAAAQGNYQSPSVPVFEFHSGFWVNLHHFLYLQGRVRAASRSAVSPVQPFYAQPVSVDGLSPAEQRAWDAAVAAYSADWSVRDLLNNDMVLIQNRLQDLENCQQLFQDRGPTRCISGLPSRMNTALNQAAPVFRAHWWPQQDRNNRDWIVATAPLVRQIGEIVGDELIQVYQRRWPPGVLRVDVVDFAGPLGAYTPPDPLHIVVSSRDPHNQGFAAFEVLFREASQLLAGEVTAAIIAECRRQRLPIPRDLAQAVVFFTAGELVRRALVNTPPEALGPGYTPYGYQRLLAERGWNVYQDALLKYWQPYMEGSISLQSAVARMISSL